MAKKQEGADAHGTRGNRLWQKHSPGDWVAEREGDSEAVVSDYEPKHAKKED